MAAPIGNEFWKLRSKHGRDKLFKSPALMMEAAEQYFTKTIERKWHINDAVKGGIMAGELIQIPTETPFTMQGLCRYLNCNTKYFNQFEDSIKDKKDKLSKDFSNIITDIREVIFQHKFEGACVGVFSHHIVALELGMVRKTEEGFRGKDGQPIDPPAPVIVTDILSNTKKKL